MTESQDGEGVESPFITGESVIPPTGVNTEVREKAEFVALRFYRDSREVNTELCLTPQEATELAEQITEKAEQLASD